MMDLTPEEELRFEALVGQIRANTDGPCQDCQTRVQAVEALFSIALGFKGAVRCLGCLAQGLKKTDDELRQQLLDHIRRRPCLRKAHEAACGPLEPGNPSANPLPLGAGDIPTHAHWWDAGQLGCGDLVLILRGKLKTLNPGDVLRVTALDPGAPEDLPAWCRMTGNNLLLAQPPDYFIQRKG